MEKVKTLSFLELKKEVKQALSSVKNITDNKKKLEALEKRFEYVKLFSTKGVQGIVGLLKLKKIDLDVVFKVAIEMDKSVEHEYYILEELNKLKEFCPNFVGSYHMTELPISKSYIYENGESESEYSSDEEEDENENEDEEEKIEKKELKRSDDTKNKKRKNSKIRSDRSHDSENEWIYENDIDYDNLNLFTYDEEYTLTNVLFMEYVNDINLYKLIKYGDRNMIYSQVLSILCGLSIAQKYSSFTHYDLHIENVLIKKIDDNIVYLYILPDGEKVIVPTWGFCPVIIDMGSSYAKNCENNSMKVSCAHYNKGLQSTLYDKLNDIHHLLLNLFTEVEYDTEEFYFVTTRIMWYFRHIPILRERGWKILPNNILKNTLKYIEKQNKDIYNFEVYDKYDKYIIEVLSYGVKLPWNVNESYLSDILLKEYKGSKEEILKSAVDMLYKFIKEFTKFYNMVEIKSDTYNTLYVLKEIVDLVYLHKDVVKSTIHKDNIKKMVRDLKSRTVCCFPTIFPGNIEWNNLFYGCKIGFGLITSLYSEYVKDNMDSIKDNYGKTEVKSVKDIIKFFKKNVAMRYEYKEDTVIEVYDSVKKNKKVLKMRDIFKSEEIEEINKKIPMEIEKEIVKRI